MPEVTTEEKPVVVEKPVEEMSAAQLEELKSGPNSTEPEPEERVELTPENKEVTDDKPAEADKKKAESTEFSPPVEEAQKKADREAEEISRVKVERELGKPIERVDMEKFTPREKGLFFEMRRQKRRAQQAEEERDKLKFDTIQKNISDQLKKELVPAGEGEGEEFLTRAQAEKIADDKIVAIRQESEKLRNETVLRIFHREAKDICPDLDEVLNYAKEVIESDGDAKDEMETARVRGENLVITAYQLVKASPRWSEIEKKINSGKVKAVPERINEDRAKRIEENEAKPKATGSGGGTPPVGDFTPDQIVTMTNTDYANLSPAQRRKIIDKWG